MAKCYTCGFENERGAEWCTKCGAVLPYKKDPPPESRFPQDLITNLKDHPPSLRSKLALLLGILSIVLLFLTGVCSPLAGIFAITVGNREMKLIHKREYSSRGEMFCQIGVWSGYITGSMSLLLLGYGIVAGAWLFKWFEEAFKYY
jgi:hypothetical protein